MRFSKDLQKILSDFVFRDSRLESHTKVLTSQVLLASDEFHLDLVASVPRSPIPFQRPQYLKGEGITGKVFQTENAYVIEDLERYEPRSQIFPRDLTRSAIFFPIKDGEGCLGVLRLESSEPCFFRPADYGRMQILGALISFIHAKSRSKLINTDAASRLGRALSEIRAELGLTQDELAYRGQISRIALSQWERGRWPPSFGPIYRWCAALGLVAEDDEPQVSFLDVTPQMIALLRDNPHELQNLSPERFEHLIAERMDRMGYDVQLTGATTRRDGGIDIIALPKLKTIGSFLMAVQVKHHRTNRTTGRAEVDRMLAWKDSPFRVGAMVTNTSFSHDAKWLADQANNKAFLRLRDFEDLKRWLQGQFESEFDWREIPDVISLAPGITVPVPKGRLTNSKDIWPLAGVNILNNYPEDE